VEGKPDIEGVSFVMSEAIFDMGDEGFWLVELL